MLSHAEATKEIFTDAGLYSPKQNLFIYNSNSPTLNNPDSTAPEGVRSFWTHQPSGEYSGWGIYNVAGPNAPQNGVIQTQDFSDYADGSIRFMLKSSIQLRLTIETGTSGLQPAGVIIPPTGNMWTEIVVPINSLGPVDLTHVAASFILIGQPGGVIDYYVDHIRWTRLVNSLVISPVSVSANTGAHREFIAEGRSAANEFIDIYPTWSETGNNGTVNPAGVPSRYVILTMGTQNATVTAQSDGHQDTASSALSNVVPPPFGIVSETVAGLHLDVDSSIRPLGTVTLADDSSAGNFVEGTKSTSAQVSGFGGWFVQWGAAANDPDSNTRDMSAFYDGSIRFWFKAPATFQNLMQVSLRSGNVAGGTELSKVSLVPYATCDNTWHQVSIPLSVFAKAAPWADLARMKVFFAIYSIGPGAGTFWVDNLRWDPSAPGSLASIVITPASPVSIPLGGNRSFSAQGFDGPNGTGLPVDILPTWSASPGLGSIAGSPGATVTLTAALSPIAGTLSAAVGSINASVNVNVADVAYTQSYNVFSDAGTGGTIGVSKGPTPGSTDLTLDNRTDGGAPGNTHYMRANWTLVNTPGQTDAFAVWFVGETFGSRFMQSYADGFLQFWVRTTTDLQVSLRSVNIDAGKELCKFRLSELGIPTNGNWQKVTIPLANFKLKEPQLDFGQIANYLTIGVLASQGVAGSGTFDVANVQWLTSSQDAISPAKVYAGLVAKQNPTTGLVLSYDNDPDRKAVTYDQAVAAMNYTYQGGADNALAAKVFSAYQSLYTGSGFYETYNRDTKSVIINTKQTTGPNAWLLLALIHYRNATGDATFDVMMNGLASWLLTLQDHADGGMRFGYEAGVLKSQKSTEHNFDCYAAFNAYYRLTGNTAYQTAAAFVSQWIANTVWNPTTARFTVGRNANGTVNPDIALDAYSWAPLAMSSYTAVLASAQTDFRNTKTSDLTGFSIDGFDLGGAGAPATYKDAVWLEGTAQMVSAYWFAKDRANANYFLNQIEKAITSTSMSTQGLAYATNGGTGFDGFAMDSLHPAISSMGWYLFAKNRFNPFHPYAAVDVQVKNIADNGPATALSWSEPVLPAGWIMANQYLELTVQPITSQNVSGGPGTQGLPVTQGGLWETRIYTDNTEPGTAVFPQWQDPTPALANNSDSNPAGLIEVRGSTYTQHMPLPLAWSVKDSADLVTTGLVAADPQVSAQWVNFLDLRTPWIDVNKNGTVDAADTPSVPDNPALDALIVRRGNLMHSAQGPDGYFDSLAPLDIYLEANFLTASTPNHYETNIVLESFSQ